MKSRIVGIIAAVAVLGISIFMKKNSVYASHIDSYYVLNLIIISATVAVALAASVAITHYSRKKADTRDSGESTLPNRRDYYRVSYEPHERPVLRIESPSLALTGEHEFQVLDISEQGIRFLNDQNVHFSRTVQGELIFVDGEAVAIEGTIVREKGSQLSVKLSAAIPFKAVIKEQRRIISDQRYKAQSERQRESSGAKSDPET